MPMSDLMGNNRLAARVFGLVASLILVPVFLTGILAYLTLEQQVRSIKSDQMRADVKGWTLEALQRIRMLDDIMRSNVELVVVSAVKGAYRNRSAELFNRNGFIDIEILPLQDLEFEGLVFPLAIDMDEWATGEADRPPVVASRPVSEQRGELVFLYRLPGHEYVLLGVADNDYLWGTEEYFDYQTWRCVVAENQVTLFCPTDNGKSFGSALSSGSASGHSDSLFVEYAGEEFVGAYWTLGSPPDIFIPNLKAGVFQTKGFVNEAVKAYRYKLFPAVGIAIVVAAWLSLVLIRRQLRPLKELAGAAAQIADGNFIDTLQIDTKDEFSELGVAFDQMRKNLGRQFNQLSTLSEIDKLILEGSELTPIIAASISGLQELLPGWMGWLTLFDRQAEGQECCYFMQPDGQISVEDNTSQHDLIADLAKVAGSMPVERNGGACCIPYGALERAFLLPMISDGETIGYVGLGSTSCDRFQQGELAMVSDFVGRLGVAVASIRRDEELFVQGHYDALTGLPNRELFKQHLQSCIDAGGVGALMFIDIDRFKIINDSEGHSIGDKVLIMAANRISAAVGDVGLVARLGGDEFTVIFDQVNDEATLSKVSTAVLESLQEPFAVGHRRFFINGSIGIALLPEHGNSVETLLRKADSAMYIAKEKGGGRAEFYQAIMGENIRRRAQADRDLRRAFRSNQLAMYYQPQFDTRSGALVGAEALMRWPQPSEHMLSTAEFIELAESSGLIVELGQWALEQACEDYVWFCDHGIELASLSVNVSGRQLKEPNFVNIACMLLEKYRIPSGIMQLEVTETVLMDEHSGAKELFIALQKAGFRIGIDDFGTGYSSLSYLRQFVFDTLKIDKTFVQDLPDDVEACAIAEAILAMARGLNKQVIAEGVETRKQLDYLSAQECYLVQGFFYSQALEKRSFLKMADRFAHPERSGVHKKIKARNSVLA